MPLYVKIIIQLCIKHVLNLSSIILLINTFVPGIIEDSITAHKIQQSNINYKSIKNSKEK